MARFADSGLTALDIELSEKALHHSSPLMVRFGPVWTGSTNPPRVDKLTIMCKFLTDQFSYSSNRKPKNRKKADAGLTSDNGRGRWPTA